MFIICGKKFWYKGVIYFYIYIYRSIFLNKNFFVFYIVMVWYFLWINIYINIFNIEILVDEYFNCLILF